MSLLGTVLIVPYHLYYFAAASLKVIAHFLSLSHTHTHKIMQTHSEPAGLHLDLFSAGSLSLGLCVFVQAAASQQQLEQQ